MARAVLPSATAKQLWLLGSRADRSDPDGTDRAVPLEEDDTIKYSEEEEATDDGVDADEEMAQR